MVNRYFLGIVIASIVTGFYFDYTRSTDFSHMHQAYAFTIGKSPCNCTLDLISNMTGFELPNIKIIKNESMQSQTEGTLIWTESKQVPMDGILVGGVYLANQSAGALADLNTIKLRRNQPLALEVTGGMPPDAVKMETLNPITAINNTALKLGDIQTDKKISESAQLFNRSSGGNPFEQNRFELPVPPALGKAVLIVSLLYNNNNTKINTSSDNGTTALPNQADSFSIAGIYKALLSFKGK